ncbi:MAG TPA: chemotaxis protein CheD [Clostridiales bacterium]|nr:chemotaxis protein CheD [Clostridiales bacterium]
MKPVIIGMAELDVVKCPQNITTLGLGSCVGVCLYDKATKVGGMVHVVLPDSRNAAGGTNRAKFADTGVVELYERMIKAGARKATIVAKLAGGAHMFGGAMKSDALKVGERNAFNSKMALLKLRIPIIAEDLGGEFGRTIELDTNDGMLMIRTVGKGAKKI